MSKFSGLAELVSQPREVTPSEHAARAAQSVQTSLFTRLRKAHGGPLAGRLAWMLVRAGQEGHADSDGALSALAGFPEPRLRELLTASRAARDNLRDGRAVQLARAVVVAIEESIAARGISAGS